jgi:hypothetical protein
MSAAAAAPARMTATASAEVENLIYLICKQVTV